MRRALTTIAAVVLLLGLAAGCGLGPRLRLAPTEAQRQTRDLAVRIAAAVDRHGLPPGTPAGRALARSTAEAAAEAGPPAQAIPLDTLIPPATAASWDITRRQAEGLRTKGHLLLRSLTKQVERIGQLAGWLQASERPVPAGLMAEKLRGLAGDAESAVAVAVSIPVPEDPQLSAAEQAAAESMARQMEAIASAAAAQAARRPTVLDVAEDVLGEADWWSDQLGPLLLGIFPGAAAVAIAIKKARDLARARRERDGTIRSAETIVMQNQAIMDGPVGKTKLIVAGQSVKLSDLMLAQYSGQDAATRALVDRAKADLPAGRQE